MNGIESLVQAVREEPFDWARWTAAASRLEECGDRRADLFRSIGEQRLHRSQVGTVTEGRPCLRPMDVDWTETMDGTRFLRRLPARLAIRASDLASDVLERLAGSFAFGLLILCSEPGREQPEAAGLQTLWRYIEEFSPRWLRSLCFVSLNGRGWRNDRSSPQRLAEVLNGLELREFGLSGFELTFESAKILKPLAACRNLKVLQLRNCGLQANDLQQLETLRDLTGLDLAGNRVPIDSPAGRSFTSFAAQNRSLSLLDLSGVGLGHAGGEALRALEGLEHLRELKLEANECFENWREVIPLLRPPLRSLDLGLNQLGRLASGFLDAIAAAPEIEQLLLSRNGFGSGAPRILRPLATLTELRHLDLSYASLDQSEENPLEAIAECRGLVELELNGNRLGNLGRNVLRPLCSLQNLRRIMGHDNNFRTFDPRVAELVRSLPNLEHHCFS